MYNQYLDEVIQIRRQLHANPQLGFEEEETARFIANYLAELGIEEIRTGVAGTGVCLEESGSNACLWP